MLNRKGSTRVCRRWIIFVKKRERTWKHVSCEVYSANERSQAQHCRYLYRQSQQDEMRCYDLSIGIDC